MKRDQKERDHRHRQRSIFTENNIDETHYFYFTNCETINILTLLKS